MARWRCDLRPSRVARWLQRGLHGAVIGALLFSPWEGCWAWAKLPLLAAVGWEAQRAARRLNHLHGELNIDERGNWRWRGESWRLLRPPRWLPFGAQVALRSAEGLTTRFWLMRDAMTPAAWRALRALWFTRGGQSE